MAHPSIQVSPNNPKDGLSFYSSLVKYEIQSNMKLVKELLKIEQCIEVKTEDTSYDEKLNEIEKFKKELLSLFNGTYEHQDIVTIKDMYENSLEELEMINNNINSENKNYKNDIEENYFEKLSGLEKQVDMNFKAINKIKIKSEIKKKVNDILANLDNVIESTQKQLANLYSKYSLYSKNKLGAETGQLNNLNNSKNKKYSQNSPKLPTLNQKMSTRNDDDLSNKNNFSLNILDSVKYSTEFPMMKKLRSRVSILPTTQFNDSITLKDFRKGIIGRNTIYRSPFGELIALYADDTASGRPHKIVENYIRSILPVYANTHSENSHYAVTFNALFHSAQKFLHEFYNAPSNYVVIGTGNGASGAISHWQETLNRMYPGIVTNNISDQQRREKEEISLPIALVTEFEHHSNIISWINWGFEVQPISYTAEGNWDKGLKDLEEKLNQYKDRPLIIVSTTAASNITSQKTPLVAISSIIKSFKQDNPDIKNKLLWSVDIAAYASHNKLDIKFLEMDAVFVSVHKLTGGPGSCGILIFNGDHYADDVAPTKPAGGTVDLVYGYKSNNIVFTKDIASRETAGTPGILQFIRVALTYQLQDSLGYNLIKQREHELTAKVFEYIKNMNLQWEKHGKLTRIKILGPSDYHERLSVIAVLVIDNSGEEIPFKLSHRILSDLFGIQSRSGCNCAGPFGVELLNIEKPYIESKADEIRKGNFELKNRYGWLRFNIHFSFTDEDLNYLLNALGFLAENAFTIRDHFYEMKNLNWVLKRNSRFTEEDYKCSMSSISKNTVLDVRKPFNIKEAPEAQRNSYLLRNFENAELLMNSIKNQA